MFTWLIDHGINDKNFLFPFALYFDPTQRSTATALRNHIPGVLINAHRPRESSFFHSAGSVYGITPDIVLIFSVPDDSGDHGTDMNANPHLPSCRQHPCSDHHL